MKFSLTFKIFVKEKQRAKKIKKIRNSLFKSKIKKRKKKSWEGTIAQWFNNVQGSKLFQKLKNKTKTKKDLGTQGMGKTAELLRGMA